MTDDTPPAPPNTPPTPPRPARDGAPDKDARQAKPVTPARDDRLKAALRANLARRKAQSRARKAAPDPKD